VTPQILRTVGICDTYHICSHGTVLPAGSYFLPMGKLFVSSCRSDKVYTVKIIQSKSGKER